MNKLTLPLNQISKTDVSLCGGKGASLGELVKIGMPVPEGFVVKTKAHEEFLSDNELTETIKKKLAQVKIEDTEAVGFISGEIQKLILEGQISEGLQKEILENFEKLRAEYVAVRSSATAEDTTRTSFAGQLSTLLNTTKKNLIDNVKKCWASLFTPRAISYMKTHNLLGADIKVAVIIQKMVDAEASGVAFTIHPVSKDKNIILIEAGFGLGEAIVSGMVTPDTILVDKRSLKIISYKIGHQRKMIIREREVDLSGEKQKQRKLSKEKAIELAKFCVKIENHFQHPQDIEWALEKGKLYLLQARPVTVL